MAKNRPSFGDSVSKGLQESYNSESRSTNTDPVSSNAPALMNGKVVHEESSVGINPYYDYHPKIGQRGGTIGRPRQTSKRIQMSIGCTEEEKLMYIKAAAVEERKLSVFVNRAIKEYILNHGIDKLI